jgi:hypothetical protein
MFAPDKWHQKLYSLQRLIREENPTVTRIATIDTGLDCDPDMADFYDRRAEAYCFLEEGCEPTPVQGDEDGHGTHLASIILDTGVSCRVYSARIARRRDDFQGGSMNMQSRNNIFSRIARVSTS